MKQPFLLFIHMVKHASRITWYLQTLGVAATGGQASSSSNLHDLGQVLTEARTGPTVESNFRRGLLEQEIARILHLVSSLVLPASFLPNLGALVIFGNS